MTLVVSKQVAGVTRKGFAFFWPLESVKGQWGGGHLWVGLTMSFVARADFACQYALEWVAVMPFESHMRKCRRHCR